MREREEKECKERGKERLRRERNRENEMRKERRREEVGQGWREIRESVWEIKRD